MYIGLNVKYRYYCWVLIILNFYIHKISILLTVQHLVMILGKWPTNLTHNSFLCIYFNSLHVSSNLVLIIRRINCINTTSGICHFVSRTVSCAGPTCTRKSTTQSDIYQMLYWYNLFSWWWARGCSKHVENWYKHIEKIVRQVSHLPKIITRCKINKT
jgi:hypothetical protein